jgi:hypothetical protein
MLSFLAGTAYWDPAVPRAGNLVLLQLAQWAWRSLYGSWSSLVSRDGVWLASDRQRRKEKRQLHRHILKRIPYLLQL